MNNSIKIINEYKGSPRVLSNNNFKIPKIMMSEIKNPEPVLTAIGHEKDYAYLTYLPILTLFLIFVIASAIIYFSK
jgi:hypothetical protein